MVAFGAPFFCGIGEGVGLGCGVSVGVGVTLGVGVVVSSGGAVADGDGDSLGAGVGVGVASRSFLIFVPKDSSAASGATIVPKKIAAIRKTRNIVLIAETKS